MVCRIQRPQHRSAAQGLERGGWGLCPQIGRPAAPTCPEHPPPREASRAPQTAAPSLYPARAPRAACALSPLAAPSAPSAGPRRGQRRPRHPPACPPPPAALRAAGKRPLRGASGSRGHAHARRPRLRASARAPAAARLRRQHGTPGGAAALGLPAGPAGQRLAVHGRRPPARGMPAYGGRCAALACVRRACPFLSHAAWCRGGAASRYDSRPLRRPGLGHAGRCGRAARARLRPAGPQ